MTLAGLIEFRSRDNVDSRAGFSASREAVGERRLSVVENMNVIEDIYRTGDR